MFTVENLKSWFSRHRKPVLLGVDISLSTVKMVELAKLGNELMLVGYAVVPIGPQESQAPVNSKIEATGAAVKKALRQLGTDLTHAASAVPNASVITKTLKFSSTLSEDEIAAQIELEAEHYIPYPITEVSLDFATLDGSEDRSGLNSLPRRFRNATDCR